MFCFILVYFLDDEKEGMELEGWGSCGRQLGRGTDWNILDEKLFSI